MPRVRKGSITRTGFSGKGRFKAFVKVGRVTFFRAVHGSGRLRNQFHLEFVTFNDVFGTVIAYQV